MIGVGVPSTSRLEAELTSLISGGNPTLTLKDRYLKDQGCVAVCQAVKAAAAAHVIALNLGGNDIQAQGALALADLLRTSSIRR